MLQWAKYCMDCRALCKAGWSTAPTQSTEALADMTNMDIHVAIPGLGGDLVLCAVVFPKYSHQIICLFSGYLALASKS